MPKKKKIWKSTSLSSSKKSSADKIRTILCEFVKGRLPAAKNSERAFDILSDEFDKIEALDSDREIIELLAWFINTDVILDNVDEHSELAEDFECLYADASALFSEKAENFKERNFVIDLLHDLVINSAGGTARSELFLSANTFLNKSELGKLVDDVLFSLNENSLENEEYIFTALQDLADGANDPILYEKISFIKDPDRATSTIVAVANAYYVAGDINNAERLLHDIKDSAALEDEEDLLDLQTGILFKKGEKKAALKMAETLYEKFPKEYHLMCLCQVTTKKRKEELLDQHERFRLGVYVNPDYVNMLITMNEFSRLSSYLERYKSEIPMLDKNVGISLAERLKSVGKDEIASIFS